MFLVFFFGNNDIFSDAILDVSISTFHTNKGDVCVYVFVIPLIISNY